MRRRLSRSWKRRTKIRRFGIRILSRSIEEPLRQIVTNAGEDAAVVLAKVKEGKGTFGYNAASGDYGDMLEMGILDPTKVTRLALQNAASVAGLLLTTEVMIAEAPKEEAEHAHGGGGGMGGMGGMGGHGYVRRWPTGDSAAGSGQSLTPDGQQESPALRGFFFAGAARSIAVHTARHWSA